MLQTGLYISVVSAVVWGGVGVCVAEAHLASNPVKIPSTLGSKSSATGRDEEEQSQLATLSHQSRTAPHKYST